MKNRIKRVIRNLHRNYTAGLTAELEKQIIRQKVVTRPLDETYPYDAEAKLLRELDLGEKAMFDIGANTGFFSAVMEDIVTPEKLYLFEPIPNLYKYLLMRFKKANVLNLAISNQSGKQVLRLPYINHEPYDSRATLSGHHVEENQTHFDEIEVNLTPLDDFIDQFDLDEIGLVKIDVEGHELEVIEGAKQTFERFKPLIFIEIEARHHNGITDDVFCKLTELGFRGYFMDPLKKELNSISNFCAERDQSSENLRLRKFHQYHNNFFFVHAAGEEDFVQCAARFLENEGIRFTPS